MFTREEKLWVQDRFDTEKGWVVVEGFLGEDISVTDYNKEVVILYADMDSRPCLCRAKYVYNNYFDRYWLGMSGSVEGLKMMNVIAYRRLLENEYV